MPEETITALLQTTGRRLQRLQELLWKVSPRPWKQTEKEWKKNPYSHIRTWSPLWRNSCQRIISKNLIKNRDSRKERTREKRRTQNYHRNYQRQSSIRHQGMQNMLQRTSSYDQHQMQTPHDLRTVLQTAAVEAQRKRGYAALSLLCYNRQVSNLYWADLYLILSTILNLPLIDFIEYWNE